MAAHNLGECRTAQRGIERGAFGRVHRAEIVLEVLAPEQPLHGLRRRAPGGGGSSIAVRGLPNIHRVPRQGHAADRGMEDEIRYPRHACGSTASRAAALERRGVGGIEHLRQRPFEARDLRENRLFGERRTPGQKIRELAPIPADGAVHRGVRRDEQLAQRRERLIAQQLVKHRIGVVERIDQADAIGIAVNVEACLRRAAAVRRRWPSGCRSRRATTRAAAPAAIARSCITPPAARGPRSDRAGHVELRDELAQAQGCCRRARSSWAPARSARRPRDTASHTGGGDRMIVRVDQVTAEVAVTGEMELAHALLRHGAQVRGCGSNP